MTEIRRSSRIRQAPCPVLVVQTPAHEIVA
jgi:hypothetical protein